MRSEPLGSDELHRLTDCPERTFVEVLQLVENDERPRSRLLGDSSDFLEEFGQILVEIATVRDPGRQTEAASPSRLALSRGNERRDHA